MFRKENTGEFMLAILFIIYLIMGYRTPQMVASAVDTTLGKVVIFIVVVMMFLQTMFPLKDASFAINFFEIDIFETSKLLIET